jgi:hypothetical protein
MPTPKRYAPRASLLHFASLIPCARSRKQSRVDTKRETALQFNEHRSPSGSASQNTAWGECETQVASPEPFAADEPLQAPRETRDPEVKEWQEEELQVLRSMYDGTDDLEVLSSRNGLPHFSITLRPSGSAAKAYAIVKLKVQFSATAACPVRR